MTMAIKEMIEVLQAYEAGQKIEYRSSGPNKWKLASEPCWDFGCYEYRIAKPEPRKIKMLCWFNGSHLYWRIEDENEIVPEYWIRVPAEDKEIQID